MKPSVILVIAASLLLAAPLLSYGQTATAKDPLDRVLAELQAGHDDKAMAALDEVIKQQPKNADAYLLRGSLTAPLNPAAALADLNKVIELKPDSGTAYNQRALLRLMNQDVAGALQDLDAAVAHNYKGDGVYGLRAQLRSQLGDLKGALADYDLSIKLNPNNPRSYASRGALLLAMGDGDRALIDFDYLLKWYETDPKTSRPTPKEASKDQKTIKQGEEKKASDPQAFTVGIDQETKNEAPGDKEMAPSIVDAYARRALIYSDRGNPDAAISDLTKALRIDPGNFDVLFSRFNAYEAKGDLAAALADVNRGIANDSRNGNLRVEHGVLLLLMGKDLEAKVDFDMLLESDRVLWQKRIDERLAVVKKLMPSSR
jgi:tetratricopeptide (TPR) repeat protein